MADLLAPVSVLRTLLKKTSTEIPDTDPYSLLILEQASDMVRAAANQLTWVYVAPGDTVPTGKVAVPREPAVITAWLAYRVWTNPSNLQRRTSGPVSETWFENGLVGLELTDKQREDLAKYAESTSSRGLFIQPLASARTVSPSIFLFDSIAGELDGSSILYADGVDAGAFE